MMNLMERKADHNERLFARIMKNWNCSRLEACASVAFDCDTLEATRKAIATAVTYNRLLKSLLPEAIRFMKEEYHKGQPEDFIQSEARELVEEQAHTFAYDWEQIHDYDTISETEKEAVI